MFAPMTPRLLEAVPNFSEGRDAGTVRAIVEAMRAAGGDVLDWHMDPDHHRSVVTVVGSPEVVEEAALAGARVALERIDLSRHRGVHPRIGAVDVLPFVPLVGLTLQDARAVARRAGARLAREHDVPIFYYGEASDPPGRTLAELRQGGYETLVEGWPEGREPDERPARETYGGAHPRYGATCVGARDVLLAWNVRCSGVDLAAARRIAASLRARNGGLPGVRALGLQLPSSGAIQISMNLENPQAVPPIAVFQALERALEAEGGRVDGTEVIGLVPDALVVSAATDRLRLDAAAGARLLSRRLLEHMAGQDRDRSSASAPRGE